jgi:intracellular sulfur oxidation DsrE/DsrF family protein
MSDHLTPRRSFLGRAVASLAAVAALPSVGLAVGKGAPRAPDEAWLEGLTGKHRQYFDVAVADSRALARVSNFIDVYAEAYGTKDADINVVFGAHGGATALMLNDAMWDKYGLGRRTNMEDPATRAPAKRNIVATGGLSVARLQERGVRFIVCMRSIRRLSGELAGPNGSAEQVRTELLGNLLPRVTAVPAAIVATNRAQEAGLTYVYIG